MNNVLGTSYSPTIRFLKDGEFKQWEKNLMKAVEDKICVYLIITLSKEFIKKCDPVELVNYLIKRRIFGFHFDPLTRDGNAVNNWEKIVVSPEQYDSYKIAFAKEFIKKRGYELIPKNEIVNRARVFLGDAFFGCCSRNCYERVFTINSDNSIGGCPNKSNKEIYGSLDDDFEKILNSSIRRNLIIKEKTRRLECLNCEVFEYCNGGCVQTNGCYEGKNFYLLLKERFDNDPRFRKWITYSET